MSSKTNGKRFDVKSLTSLTLTVAFLGITVTGIMLYVAPHGPTARDWTFWGLGKRDWNHLHMTLAALFMIATVFHLIWNWSMLWGYIKKRTEAGLNRKLELVCSILIGVVVVTGTLYDIPPFSSIIQWKQTLSGSWGGDEGGGGQSGQGEGRGLRDGQGRQYRGGR